MTSYVRYIHTVELYTEAKEVGLSGQRKSSWNIDRTLPCYFLARSAFNRQYVSFEDKDRDILYVPSYDQNGQEIDLVYGMRLRNVKDRFGDLIRGNSTDRENFNDSEYFLIRRLIKHPGWTGKLRMYEIFVDTVIEEPA